MIQALLAGVSSIKAQQTDLNVIGNNLANVNTTGFKGSDVQFKSMLSQTLQGAEGPQGDAGGTNPIQVGLGTLVGSTSVDQGQGSLNATGVPSDMAIQGNGFFMVSNGSAISYSRDGSFSLDSNGDLIQNSTGQKLVGWGADNQGKINTASTLTAANSLTIPLGSLNVVQATQNVHLTGNLSGTATSADTWTTTATVYDSLGGATPVTIQYSNRQTPPAASGTTPASATASWDWTVYPGTSTTGVPLASSSDAGKSPIYFDTNGNYVAPTGAPTNTFSLPAAGGSAGSTVNLDFSQISQVDTDSSVSLQSQDGYPAGSLSSFSIGKDGTVAGTFTNGLTRPLGQIALATFANTGGLQSDGNNLWQPTANSGSARVESAGGNGTGQINAGFLEQSNVDMSQEFTKLIVTQTAFQANTKIVTTANEMMQTLIAMKQ